MFKIGDRVMLKEFKPIILTQPRTRLYIEAHPEESKYEILEIAKNEFIIERMDNNMFHEIYILKNTQCEKYMFPKRADQFVKINVCNTKKLIKKVNKGEC